MKALRFHQYGGPEVLQFDDIPVPQPGPGQLLVKVAGAGINPVDWKIREGHVREYFPLDLPATTLCDFSGAVAALGEGVTDFEVGAEVYGLTNSGSCAEYCLAEAAAVAHAPAGLDLADAASIPMAALTAYQALFTVGNLQPGQRVFIQAGSGGVGSFAIQLAKWKGAHVITTTSTRNVHLVQEMGADEVIDYTAVPFETVVSDVDLAIEAVGAETMLRTLSVVKPGGLLLSVTSQEPTEEAAAQGKRTEYVWMKPNREDLSRIAALIQDIKVRPVISAVVRFDDAIKAIKESQTGRVVGKLVVRVS